MREKSWCAADTADLVHAAASVPDASVKIHLANHIEIRAAKWYQWKTIIGGVPLNRVLQKHEVGSGTQTASTI